MRVASQRDAFGTVTTSYQSRWAQGLTLAYLSVGVWYLWWRTIHTINWDAPVLSFALLFADYMGFGFFLLFAFNLWSRVRREAAPAPAGLTVDVLIPTYNEPISVLKPTVLSALAMDYPHETYVLDDGRRPEVAALCAELGARYLTRPDNQGAKAGNINAALSQIRGEFIAIFDADHAPFHNFLTDLLGYFNDPGVALVQAPQAYYNIDSFQHARQRGHARPWHEQSVFYDSILPGKDRFNAAFWCGSSAVVRRAALLQVGGVNTLTVTEDMHTAMKMHQAGWKSVYHDRELAVGIAPDDLEPFLVQRLRWAQGAVEILRKDNPLRARGLTFKQRLSYFTSAAYVLEYVPKALYLVMPPIVLFTGVLPMTNLGWNLVVRFLPYYLLGMLATQALTGGTNPLVRAERFHLLKVEIMLRALTLLVWPRKLTFKVTSKSADGSEHRMAVLAQIKSLIAVGGLCAAAAIWGAIAWFAGVPWALSGLSLVLTTLWALFNAGLTGSVAQSVLRRRHRRDIYRFPATVPLVATIGSRREETITTDLSGAGLGWMASRWYGVGQRIRVSLRPDGQPPISADAIIASCHRSESGFRVGAEFAGLPADDERRLLLMLFQETAPISVTGARVTADAPARAA